MMDRDSAILTLGAAAVRAVGAICGGTDRAGPRRGNRSTFASLSRLEGRDQPLGNRPRRFFRPPLAAPREENGHVGAELRVAELARETPFEHGASPDGRRARCTPGRRPQFAGDCCSRPRVRP